MSWILVLPLPIVYQICNSKITFHREKFLGFQLAPQLWRIPANFVTYILPHHTFLAFCINSQLFLTQCNRNNLSCTKSKKVNPSQLLRRLSFCKTEQSSGAPYYYYTLLNSRVSGTVGDVADGPILIFGFLVWNVENLGKSSSQQNARPQKMVLRTTETAVQVCPPRLSSKLTG